MLNLLLALLTLGVVAVVAALFTGLLSGGGLAEETSSVPVRALPEGPLGGQEVRALRFAAALRGYRMDQVDAALDRLGTELDLLRAQVAEARAAESRAAPSPPSAYAAKAAREAHPAEPPPAQGAP